MHAESAKSEWTKSSVGGDDEVVPDPLFVVVAAPTTVSVYVYLILIGFCVILIGGGVCLLATRSRHTFWADQLAPYLAILMGLGLALGTFWQSRRKRPPQAPPPIDDRPEAMQISCEIARRWRSWGAPPKPKSIARLLRSAQSECCKGPEVNATIAGVEAVVVVLGAPHLPTEREEEPLLVGSDTNLASCLGCSAYLLLIAMICLAATVVFPGARQMLSLVGAGYVVVGLAIPGTYWLIVGVLRRIEFVVTRQAIVVRRLGTWFRGDRTRVYPLFAGTLIVITIAGNARGLAVRRGTMRDELSFDAVEPAELLGEAILSRIASARVLESIRLHGDATIGEGG